MKSTTPRLNRLAAIGALFSLSLFALAQSSRAAPLYFDAGHDTTWDDGISDNWSASPGGPYNQSWTGGADAHFEGTGGTVTVDGTITSVNAIVFDAAGYSLTGGTMTLTGDASVTTADYDGTLAGSIDGSAAGFVKDGQARLTVSGASSFGSGGAIQTVTVSDGTLRLNQSGLGWSSAGWGDGAPILVSSGAVLDVAANFNAGITRSITIDGGTLDFTAGSSSDSNNYANNLTLNDATVRGNRIRLGYGSDALFTVSGTTTIDSALQLVRLRADAQGDGQLVLDVDTGALLTVTGGITDRSGHAGTRVVKDGEGTMEVRGASSFTGGVFVEGGTLRLNQSGLGWSGSGWGDGTPILVSSGAVLEVAGNFNAGITRSITIDGGILDFTAGSSSDSENYANNLTLNDAMVTGNRIRLGYGSDASFTVTGTTTIASALQLVRLRADAQGDGQLVLDVDTGALLTVTGGITDRSGLEGLRVVKDGEGTMEVSGASSFTGGVFVEGGTLRLNQPLTGGDWNEGGWGDWVPIVVAAGATLEAAHRHNLGFDRPVTLDGGTLHLSASDPDDSHNYVNTLALKNGAQVTGNYMRFHGNAAPTVTVSGSAASTIDTGIRMWGGGANQAVFDVANVTGSADADLTVTGAIIDNSGSMAIVKNGDGTLVFAGANTYSGTTAVNAGTLLVDGDSGGATGVVTVAAGATLGGTGTIGGATTLAGGAALSPGAGTGTLTFGNTLTLEDGAVWDWEFVDVLNYGQAAGPNLVLPAGAETNITLNLRGLEGYSVSAGDRFTLFSGEVANFDAGRFTVVNHTGWDAGWQLSEGSLVLTASPAPLYFSAGNSTTWADDGTMANWSSSPGGPYDQAWLSGRNAHFEDTGGAVTVDGAIASVSSMSFDASGYSLSGGTIHLTGLATVTANYDTTISSSIDGSVAGMVKDGQRRLTVSGASSFGSGEAIQTITVSEGTLRLNQSGLGWSGSGWGNNAPIVVDSEATLELAGRFNSGHARPITVDGGTLAITTAGNSADGDNYFNDLTLRNGAVVTGRPFRVGGQVDGMVAVGGTEASDIDAGIILVGLTGTEVTFNVDAVTSGSGPDLTISGVVRDYTASQTLDVFKDGPGTLALSADNTYTSATTVNSGTLLVNNTSGSGTGTGPVTVKSGATLGGTGAIAGDTTIEDGGTLGTRMSVDSLTFGSTLTLEDGAVWDWGFIHDTAGNYDHADGPNLVLPNEGTIALNIWGLEDHSVGWYDEFTLFTGQVENFDAGLFQLENHSDWARGWSISLDNGLLLTAVPEPGAWILLLSALACGMLVRRRR